MTEAKQRLLSDIYYAHLGAVLALKTEQITIEMGRLTQEFASLKSAVDRVSAAITKEKN